MVEKVQTLTFTCDACLSETAQTSGSVPAGWMQFSNVVVSSTDFNASKDLGPVCLASTDPGILLSIKNSLLNL